LALDLARLTVSADDVLCRDVGRTGTRAGRADVQVDGARRADPVLLQLERAAALDVAGGEVLEGLGVPACAGRAGLSDEVRVARGGGGRERRAQGEAAHA